MKNILILIFFFPILLSAQSNRDKLVINNLIKVQIPELLFQKKPDEMIKLITETYTQVNYFKGVKDENIIYGKVKALEYFKIITNENFKTLTFNIKDLIISNDKAIAIGYYIATFNDSQTPVQVVEFIITLVKGSEFGWLIDQEVDLVF